MLTLIQNKPPTLELRWGVAASYTWHPIRGILYGALFGAIYGAISGRIYGTIYGTINLSIHHYGIQPKAASIMVDGKAANIAIQVIPDESHPQ